MELVVHIEGEGNVTGAGTYEIGSTASVTATPYDGWLFKQFKNGDEIINENPYNITIENDEDITIIATFYYTIEEYLRGMVAFDVPDSALVSIRVYRDVSKGKAFNELSTQTLELCYADLLLWASTSPSSITGAKESDGGWSHSEESRTLSITDKKELRAQANAIYKRYGDSRYSTSIKIVNLW